MTIKDLMRLGALMFAFTGAVACEGDGDDDTETTDDSGTDEATDSGTAE